MRAPILVVLAVATGCQTYAQHRAALVPHSTPLPTDGQPLAGAGELALGASNLADAVTPGVGNPSAGDAVPRTQLRGALTLRATPNFSLGAVYERGLASGSRAVTSSQPPIDGGDVGGMGVHMTWSIPTGTPGFRIGLSTELLLWSVPWVQYTSCVQNCDVAGFTFMDRGSDIVPTLALGIVPSYRTGRITVFGGFTARNHPTITEKVLTDLPDSDADVQAGPYNVTAQAGASVEIASGVKASLLVHQTLTADPVRYGPGIAAMLSIPLGMEEPRGPSQLPPGMTPTVQ